MSKRHSDGFTLAEAMVTLGLISLLLGVVANLMSSYAQMARHAGQAGATLYAAQLALDTISTDLRAAIVVTSPSSGTSTDIKLRRIDPWNSVRLPDSAPLPAPTVIFRPHVATDCLTIRYYVTNSSLFADTTYGDGTVSNDELIEGVSGISGVRVSAGRVQVTASVNDNSVTPPRVVSLSTEVALHAPPQVVP